MPLTGGCDDPRVSKYGKLLRHGRLAHSQLFRQFRNRMGAGSEHSQDIYSGPIAESGEQQARARDLVVGGGRHGLIADHRPLHLARNIHIV